MSSFVNMLDCSTRARLGFSCSQVNGSMCSIVTTIIACYARRVSHCVRPPHTLRACGRSVDVRYVMTLHIVLSAAVNR